MATSSGFAAVLSGQTDLLRLIYEQVRDVREAAICRSALENTAKRGSQAVVTIKAKVTFPPFDNRSYNFDDTRYPSDSEDSDEAPEPASRFLRVNMLPFIMGDKTSLPDKPTHISTTP